MTCSPFPGMAPYLEAPTIWPDVHPSLMSIVREQLPPLLAPKYLAELETQVVIDHLDDEPQVVLPDVGVTAPDVPTVAPSSVPVAAPAPVRVRVPLGVPTRLVSIHIRQRETARLVAVIELLSPVNKRRGKGREEYLEKRRTSLSSPVHVIEIDLLRSYPRMPFDDPLPPAHDLVMVCNAGERPNSRAWPISLRQPLPTIPIPLLAPDPPVPLDMGQALRTAYERARYDLRVDYCKPPVAPLSPADAACAEALKRSRERQSTTRRPVDLLTEGCSWGNNVAHTPRRALHACPHRRKATTATSPLGRKPVRSFGLSRGWEAEMCLTVEA